MFTARVRFVVQVAVVLPAFACLVSACADGGDDGGGDSLEIVGEYTDGFGAHVITADTWTVADTEVFHIVDFDNEAGVVIANNDDANEYSPGLWSRFQWVEDGGKLFYCQPVYDGENEAAARDDAGADPSDLDQGCGGFPWSELAPT